MVQYSEWCKRLEVVLLTGMLELWEYLQRMSRRVCLTRLT